MATTIADMVAATGKDVLDYLDLSAEVPKITMAGAQGDVLVVHANRAPATTAMPACVVAVASEASSNTHTLHPSGTAFWDRHDQRSDEDVLLGVLTVPDGSTVFLSHQEHGGIEICAGTFEVRRQAELGRMVHD
jgi:hypothetical protein